MQGAGYKENWMKHNEVNANYDKAFQIQWLLYYTSIINKNKHLLLEFLHQVLPSNGVQTVLKMVQRAIIFTIYKFLHKIISFCKFNQHRLFLLSYFGNQTPALGTVHKHL